MRKYETGELLIELMRRLLTADRLCYLAKEIKGSPIPGIDAKAVDSLLLSLLEDAANRYEGEKS
jgi:hypothetical protein